jgi:hypothetical protein
MRHCDRMAAAGLSVPRVPPLGLPQSRGDAFSTGVTLNTSRMSYPLSPGPACVVDARAANAAAADQDHGDGDEHVGDFKHWLLSAVSSIQATTSAMKGRNPLPAVC